MWFNFSFISFSFILSLSQYIEDFKDSLIAPSDPRHQAVELVVRILAERNQDIAEISSVPWTVHVVEGPTINAFVLPVSHIW